MRIVGTGFLATHLQPYADRHDGVTVLAAGVSSTVSMGPEPYRREADLVGHWCDRARQSGELLVFLSTASASMYRGTDATEDAPVAPRSTYARHKHALECRIAESGVDHLVVRLTHLVGPHQPDHQLLPNLVAQALTGRISVHRGAFRDLIDVDDAVALIIAVLDHLQAHHGAGGLGGTTVNVGSGQPTPIGEVIDLIEEELERTRSLPGRLHRDEVDTIVDRAPISLDRLRTLAGPVATRVSTPGYSDRLLRRHIPPLVSAATSAISHQRQ